MKYLIALFFVATLAGAIAEIACSTRSLIVKTGLSQTTTRVLAAVARRASQQYH